MTANLKSSRIINHAVIETYYPCRQYRINNSYKCSNGLYANLNRSIIYSPLYLLENDSCFHRGQRYPVFIPVYFQTYADNFTCFR